MEQEHDAVFSDACAIGNHLDIALTKLTPLNVPQLLASYHIHPSKGLGQNFLIDEAVLAEIVSRSEIPAGMTVLEIGPGLGSLTRHLAEAAETVQAVELDRHMIPVLREVLRPWKNVHVTQGDILEVTPETLITQPGYFVVANIPYYITSAVIRHLLNAAVKPGRMVLTIQKEVAQRVCAGSGNLSLLALSVQIFGEAQTLMTIPASAFLPQPKVDSALVRIDLFDTPLVREDQMDAFFKLAKAGFGQKRKTLKNALSSNLRMEPRAVESTLLAAGIDPMRRAETLSIAEWLNLLGKME